MDEFILDATKQKVRVGDFVAIVYLGRGSISASIHKVEELTPTGIKYQGWGTQLRPKIATRIIKVAP